MKCWINNHFMNMPNGRDFVGVTTYCCDDNLVKTTKAV